MERLRERVHGLLDYTNTAGLVAPILANVAAVILESEPALGDRYATFFAVFEAFSIAVFTLEFVLRLWSITAHPRYRDPVKGRLGYMATPYAVVDLLAVLPFYLPLIFPLDLRILRVLLLFELGRYSTAFGVVERVILRKRGELLVAVFVSLVLLVILSSLTYAVGHDGQPAAFPSIAGTMYWSLVTLTTLGYGDVVPHTTSGRFLAPVTSVIGVALFGLPAGILASGFFEEFNRRRGGRGTGIKAAAAAVPAGRKPTAPSHLDLDRPRNAVSTAAITETAIASRTKSAKSRPPRCSCATRLRAASASRSMTRTSSVPGTRPRSPRYRRPPGATASIVTVPAPGTGTTTGVVPA